MTPYQQAKALIALSELTYFQSYYGENIVLFNKDKVESSTDANQQHQFPTKQQ